MRALRKTTEHGENVPLYLNTARGNIHPPTTTHIDIHYVRERAHITIQRMKKSRCVRITSY